MEEVVEKSVGVVEGPSEENVVEGISVGVLDSVGVTARPSIGVCTASVNPERTTVKLGARAGNASSRIDIFGFAHEFKAA